MYNRDILYKINYSTLTEAYNIPIFESKGGENIDKKKKRKDKSVSEQNNIIEPYKKEYKNCEPLQQPHYKLPIKDKQITEDTKIFEDYLKERNLKNKEFTEIEDSNINIYDNYNSILNDEIKDIEPYYDEDLDNYININDMGNINYPQKEIKNKLMSEEFNLKTQEPLIINNKEYVLVPKKTKVKYNEIIEKDTENQEKELEDKQEENNIDVVVKQESENLEDKISEMVKLYVKEEKTPPKISNFYKNIINIVLFILIGIFVIFLLDLLTELALHKGMKQTVQILLPLLEELKELKRI
jgi:hypothetical protein